MACAVPKASLPMRSTAVLPVRKTPAASANTFGRPSKTNATMPNGETTCSTFQPSCSTLLMTLPRVGCGIAPGTQAGDHVATHALIGQQACGGTSARLGPFDVGTVGGFDLRPALRGFQTLREQIEKLTDRFVGHRRQRGKRRSRTFDRHRGALVGRPRESATARHSPAPPAGGRRV